MNCSCIRPIASYQRVPSKSSLDIDLQGSPESSCSEPQKEVDLRFYNDDESYITMVVDEDLRASDLCQLLALKNHVNKDINWTLVEHLQEWGLERWVEDHEDVLKIYTSWGTCNKSHGNKIYFRKDFRKYEFYQSPEQFFPPDMADVQNYDECLSESPEISRTVSLQNSLDNSDNVPVVHGHMWLREGCKQVWRKAFFMISSEIIYYSYKTKDKDPCRLHRFVDLAHFNIYTKAEGRKRSKAPTDFCLSLKPINAESSKDLRCLCCETEQARLCWLTAMRVAKYGRQLRDNYKNFKSRQMETLSESPPDHLGLHVQLESVRSRVAMDFTGNYGKIVDDPKEAEAIAVAEGHYWSKKRRPNGRKLVGGILRGLDSGVHITQPWFHSGLSRDEAIKFLHKHGTVNGVFLVRESKSAKGAFVLSFVCAGKIHHTQILPVEDRDHVCFSLDGGQTKFYDLTQLVEFYQLNCGHLPTKLTHYVVQTFPISTSIDRQQEST